MENVLLENSKKGWYSLPDSAPVWVREFVTEYRSAILQDRPVTPEFRKRHARNAEMRSLSFNRSTVQAGPLHSRQVPVPVLTADQKLLRLALVSQDQTRMADIKSPDCRAVVFRNGRFWRDYEKENALREEERLFGDLSANGTLRLQQALEAKMRSYEDPEDDEDDDSDSCITPEDHTQAALYHRARARKAADWQTGAAHFTAADLHEKAAGNCTLDNHNAACAASRKLRK